MRALVDCHFLAILHQYAYTAVFSLQLTQLHNHSWHYLSYLQFPSVFLSFLPSQTGEKHFPSPSPPLPQPVRPSGCTTCTHVLHGHVSSLWSVVQASCAVLTVWQRAESRLWSSTRKTSWIWTTPCWPGCWTLMLSPPSSGYVASSHMSIPLAIPSGISYICWIIVAE